MRLARTLAWSVLAVAALAACGPAAVATAPSPDLGPPRAFVSEGGLLRPLANGDRVALANGWAELSFSPYPPSARSDLDVLVVGAASEKPARADVSVAYEMLGMEHGTVIQRATAGANGHHVLPLNLAMPGTWRFQIKVVLDGTPSTVMLIVPEVVQ